VFRHVRKVSGVIDVLVVHRAGIVPVARAPVSR
jgi:hypothetical protein